MGFLGNYSLEVKALSPGKREIVFPKVIVEKWIRMGLEYEQEIADDDYCIGNISVRFSEEYYMFLVNSSSFAKSNKELSLEALFKKDEYRELPFAVYADSFYERPHIFNEGWEETVNPLLLKKLNDRLIHYLEKNKNARTKYQQLLDDAKKVNIMCELGIYFFIRLHVVAS